jgi:hypothetical protein
MPGQEREDDDDFPPRRPFGTPAARPAPLDPEAEDETGAPARGAGGSGSGAPRGQPPAARS